MPEHDLMKRLNLAVLFGGRSGEREVSLASAHSVMTTLIEADIQFRRVDTGVERWWRELEGVDLAINMQHGSGGEDGVTQGLLDSLGVVGTGSGVLGSALAMDKLRSKMLWQAAGLPTAEFLRADDLEGAIGAVERWGGAFVKPACAGSSLGMARVDRGAEVAEAVLNARAFDNSVIIERLIDGPEYTVTILGERALPAIRIEAGRTFYDYTAKYESGDTQYHVPCGLAPAEEAELAQLALRAFSCLGCSVWGRVDVMRDSDGRFLLLEANTIPGMTQHSLVPMAARAAGISPLELLGEIVSLSWAAARRPSAGARA